MKGYWDGKAGIVTGAASGIGYALSEALVDRGASVWMADVDASRLSRAVAAFNGRARKLVLDVRDAAAVRRAVETVVAETGQIDFIFNNAGVGMTGEMRELTSEHFDRVIDVNVRGVVNGVTAAYPHMVRQESGHIVNTASLAGLAAAPLLAPYAMSKHAVVGLGSSLHVEAARYGVRVTTLCPASIDTPMLDADTPPDLPRLSWRCDVRRYLAKLSGPPVDPDRFAEAALRGVERGKAMVIFPARARVVALMQRLVPGLVAVAGRRALEAEIADRPEPLIGS